MRNIYDNSEFFAAYAEMGRSKDGLHYIIPEEIIRPIRKSGSTIF